MSEFDDFTLRSPTEPEQEGPRGPRRGPAGPIIAGVVVAVLVTGLGYWFFRRPAKPRPQPTAPASLATPSPSPTPALSLPHLDESDTLVRELAKGLSGHPQLALWLATRELVRTFTAAVANVADGESPGPHLGFLAPKGSFGTIRKQGRQVVDPRSYTRYDAVAEGLASLDAAACADVYRRIEPLFEAAYRDRGHPAGGFSKTLARAIATLAEAPVPEGDAAVRPVQRALLVYEYVDPELESLSPAQKHLLRMGPGNARKIQAKLRELAAALGFSADSGGSSTSSAVR